MNYTKGEWAIYPSVLDTKDLVIWCEGQYIGTVRNKANAHLIAAAPLMYEELRNLLIGLDNPMRIPAFELVDKASLALAKAEGKDNAIKS